MTVKPELAGGFRDYLPQDMIPRNKMLETIKQTFERFGFVPMDTPAMEKEEVIAKDKTDFLIYKASTQDDEGKLALRYDLTVPLARVVAANPALARPFKRYQFGRVWRGEKQQVGKGRFREFTQLDADIVGSSSPMADAEMVALMYETLIALGLFEFTIKINNLKLLKQFPQEVLRAIDKLDKIGWEGVEKELGDKTAEVKAFFSKRQVNEELDALLDNLKSLGIPDEKIIVDNTVIRGFDYYTGNVFEAVIPSMPEFGSVFSGGRYDNLVERFAPFSIPAVGCSVGVDRLFAVLDELEILKRQITTAKVLVLNFEPIAQNIVQEIATDLRRENIPAELYLGQEETLKGQLSYAVKQEYPYVIIVGKEEAEKGVAQIKDMAARQQQEVDIVNIVSTLEAL